MLIRWVKMPCQSLESPLCHEMERGFRGEDCREFTLRHLMQTGVDPKKWNREKGDTLKKGRHENGTNESEVRQDLQVGSHSVI